MTPGPSPGPSPSGEGRAISHSERAPPKNNSALGMRGSLRSHLGIRDRSPLPARGGAGGGVSYAEKLSPQPHEVLAFGLTNLKPDSIKPSWYSRFVPTR